MAAISEESLTNQGNQTATTNWMEQTQYIAKTIYEDPSIGPMSLDIHSACAIGNFERVQEAVNKNEDLDQRNKGGWTPLMYASYVGHDTVVNLLLDAHVDPNKSTPAGLTPLMVAAGCGNESVCYFLIHNGAKIDQQDSRGCTALYHATRQGHQSTVQLLLKEGANMELGDDQYGYTPLMIAAMEGDQIVLDVLIACQADINAKGHDGHTARSLALKNNHIKTVSFLDEIQMAYYPRSNSAASNESDVPSVSSYPDTDDDVHSGSEEIDSMSQKIIKKNLGRRSGPRWSLPPEYITGHRASLSTTDRRLKFRQARSLPESALPPGDKIDEFDEEESLTDSTHEDSMAKLAQFLDHFGLERYYEVFDSHEIDFYGLFELSEEDLKKLIDKLGPRRKLQMAIKEVKEHMKNEENEGPMSRNDVTPTPQQNLEVEMKIQLTQMKAAYQQVVQNLEGCESRLTKEHELRKMAERYCQELQKCRAQSFEATKTLKETLGSILKHCQSLQSTKSKLSQTLKDSNKTSDQTFHSKTQELNSCIKELGGEIEAVTRSAYQANKEFNTIQYHLTASFTS